MDYLNFDLEVGQGTGQEYPVTVIHSYGGEASAIMHFPFDDAGLEDELQRLQSAILRSGSHRRRWLSVQEQTVQDFGSALFNALFTGDIRNRFDVSLDHANQHGKGLRIRLRIKSPKMASLPWEFLFDPRHSAYLCLDNTKPLVRYLELPVSIPALNVQLPLRILGMVGYSDGLDVSHEKRLVEEAVRELCNRGLVELEWIEGSYWRDLQKALRRGPWHIFHFIGHGGFDPNKDEGLLVMADEQNQAFELPASQLALFLSTHKSLRLALLNSCEGAQGGELDLFSSTASILVQRGLPSVVAMQFEITDRAAI
jgi:hypothetical protein